MGSTLYLLYSSSLFFSPIFIISLFYFSVDTFISKIIIFQRTFFFVSVTVVSLVIFAVSRTDNVCSTKRCSNWPQLFLMIKSLINKLICFPFTTAHGEATSAISDSCQGQLIATVKENTLFSSVR